MAEIKLRCVIPKVKPFNWETFDEHPENPRLSAKHLCPHRLHGLLNQVPRLPLEADEPVVALASARDNEVVNWIMVESRYDEAFTLVVEEKSAS